MISDYPYLYETHMHTCESSKCAKNNAVEMAKAHKDAGYAGMIITNHNWGGNTSVDRSLPWEEWLDCFFEPYHMAKEWGDANDFQVFYGYEAGYDGTEFLIYGVTIEWMKKHPELKDATVMEQFKMIDEAGGLVVHAHPFREAFYIKEIRLFPEWVHAVEGQNASHSSPYLTDERRNNGIFNERAVAYANEHDLIITAGSDTHTVDMLHGGVAFKNKLTSIYDYVDRIRKERDYLTTDGAIWLDPYGRRVDR